MRFERLGFSNTAGGVARGEKPSAPSRDQGAAHRRAMTVQASNRARNGSGESGRELRLSWNHWSPERRDERKSTA